MIYIAAVKMREKIKIFQFDTFKDREDFLNSLKECYGDILSYATTEIYPFEE